MQRIQGGQKRFDLILLNQIDCSVDEMMMIGQHIRQGTELGSQTPILIMAEQYGAKLEGRDLQIGNNEYVTYLEDGEHLKRILQQLCPLPMS